MKRLSHILIPAVLLLTAAVISILSPVTHAQTGTVLAAPALTADDTKANRVELSWTAVPGAVRYALWAWRDGLQDWQRLDDGDLTATSYSHEDLTAGTTYYYIIVAVDANGAWGMWSNEVNATVAAPPAGAVADPQESQSQLVENPGPAEGVKLSATATPTHTATPTPAATATPTATATFPPAPTATPTYPSAPTATATSPSAPTATPTYPSVLKAADESAPGQASQERSPSALAVTPTISPAPAEGSSENDSLGRGGSESSWRWSNAQGNCTITKQDYEAIRIPTPGPATPGASATVVAIVATRDAAIMENC